MRPVLILLMVALAGCGRERRPDPLPVPLVIEVPVRVYVPIPEQMRQRCRWVREGAPSAVFEVTEGRRRCLLRYEAQLDAIGGVQGRPAPESEDANR